MELPPIFRLGSVVYPVFDGALEGRLVVGEAYRVLKVRDDWANVERLHADGTVSTLWVCLEKISPLWTDDPASVHRQP